MRNLLSLVVKFCYGMSILLLTVPFLQRGISWPLAPALIFLLLTVGWIDRFADRILGDRMFRVNGLPPSAARRLRRNVRLIKLDRPRDAIANLSTLAEDSDLMARAQEEARDLLQVARFQAMAQADWRSATSPLQYASIERLLFLADYIPVDAEALTSEIRSIPQKELADKVSRYCRMVAYLVRSLSDGTSFLHMMAESMLGTLTGKRFSGLSAARNYQFWWSEEEPRIAPMPPGKYLCMHLLSRGLYEAARESLKRLPIDAPDADGELPVLKYMTGLMCAAVGDAPLLDDENLNHYVRDLLMPGCRSQNVLEYGASPVSRHVRSIFELAETAIEKKAVYIDGVLLLWGRHPAELERVCRDTFFIMTEHPRLDEPLLFWAEWWKSARGMFHREVGITLIGLAELQAGNYSKAADQLALAATREERFPYAAVNACIAFAMLGNREAFDNAVRTLLADFQKNAHASMTAGWYYYKSFRDYDMACMYLRRALKMDTDSFLCHYRLAEVLHHAEDYLASIKHYKRAKAQRIDDPDCDLGMGMNYLRLGEYVRAERCLESALANTQLTNRDMGHYALYQFHIHSGEWLKAAHALEKVEPSFFTRAETLDEIALSFEKHGAYDVAQRYFDLANRLRWKGL